MSIPKDAAQLFQQISSFLFGIVLQSGGDALGDAAQFLEALPALIALYGL